MLRPQRGCRQCCLLPLTCAWGWLCSSKGQSPCESRLDLRGWIQRSTSYPVSPQTDVGTRIGGRGQFPPSLPFSFQPSVLPSPMWGPFSATDAAQECPGAEEGGTRRPAPPASSQPWEPPCVSQKEAQKGTAYSPWCPRSSLTRGPRAGFRVSVLSSAKSRVSHTHGYVGNFGVYTELPQLWASGCSGPSIPVTLPGPFQMPRLGEVRSGLCLGDGSVFYSAQLVFIALPGAGERRWIWIFFQNSL